MEFFRKSSSLAGADPANRANWRNRWSERVRRLRSRIVTSLINHRKLVVIALIAIIVLAEVIENMLADRLGRNGHILFDAITYTLLVPASMWVLLSLMESTAVEREKLTRENDLRYEFSQKLGEARSWDELVERIVLYPHEIAPRANVTLAVYNPDTMQMDPEAFCSCDGVVLRRPALTGRPLTPGNPDSPNNHFNLPLARNDLLTGVISLEYPQGVTPSPAEINALKGAVPVIALALEVALLQKLAAEQAVVSETERRQIAQNLHDTLAQNISYLRLKLDQLTGENAIHEIGVVLQELERMRATADEAYQQVRSTLDELDPIRGENLSDMLVKQARVIGQRAGFELRTSETGSPLALPQQVRQQILYIAREALHNIEKHARASQVWLQIMWLDTEFILKITDNGAGFDPLALPADGHYGLWIMQNRAHEIGGMLKVSPAEERGTEVTLWVPAGQSSAGAQGVTANLRERGNE